MPEICVTTSEVHVMPVPPGKAGTFHVDVVDACVRFDCSAQESVLAGMSRLGKRGIPIGCRGGGCGICKVEVLCGSYVAEKMSAAHVNEADLGAHRVLACRIRPAGDVSLRVIGPMADALATAGTRGKATTKDSR